MRHIGITLVSKLNKIWKGYVLYKSDDKRGEMLTRSEIVKGYTASRMSKFLGILLIFQVCCSITLTLVSIK